MAYSQKMEEHAVWRKCLRSLHGVPLTLVGMATLFEELAERLTMAANRVNAFADLSVKFQHGFTVSTPAACSALPLLISISIPFSFLSMRRVTRCRWDISRTKMKRT